jgi:hypothetical protein
MTPPIRPELIDDLLDAYVDWREECGAVRDAYERWSSGSERDHSLTFAAYRAALDREQQASLVYADRSGRVTREVGRQPGTPAQGRVADLAFALDTPMVDAYSAAR